MTWSRSRPSLSLCSPSEQYRLQSVPNSKTSVTCPKGCSHTVATGGMEPPSLSFSFMCKLLPQCLTLLQLQLQAKTGTSSSSSQPTQTCSTRQARLALSAWPPGDLGEGGTSPEIQASGSSPSSPRGVDFQITEAPLKHTALPLSSPFLSHHYPLGIRYRCYYLSKEAQRRGDLPKPQSE